MGHVQLHGGINGWDFPSTLGTTCGIVGAGLGFRQDHLACISFDETEVVESSTECPPSLTPAADDKADDAAYKRRACEIFKAVADPDNPEWVAVKHSISDCDWCAIYAPQGAHPTALTCDNPRNIASGGFMLADILDVDAATGALSAKPVKPILLFQSDQGVRGIACQNGRPESPDVPDCEVQNPEVYGTIDSNDTLTLYQATPTGPEVLFKGISIINGFANDFLGVEDPVLTSLKDLRGKRTLIRMTQCVQIEMTPVRDDQAL
ncbi:MAG: hypothetical protein H6714_00750 [Myxococcales bacterium]|nr:hypothetical protein [Myxococcales bacterium]